MLFLFFSPLYCFSRMIFGQLVCRGCFKILTYPSSAISCACRNCGTVNAAQYLRLHCPCCSQSILLPINTLTFLCPVCATVTDIPEEFLPKLEDPVDLGGSESTAETQGRAQGGLRTTIYVSYPPIQTEDHNTSSEQREKEKQDRREAAQRRKLKEQRLRAHLLRSEGALNRKEEDEGADTRAPIRPAPQQAESGWRGVALPRTQEQQAQEEQEGEEEEEEEERLRRQEAAQQQLHPQNRIDVVVIATRIL